MRVVNTHKRVIPKSKAQVSQLFETLGSEDDQIWPFENWPAMRFKAGFHDGSHGGHGRIRYTIIAFQSGNSVTFQFTKPDGFYGTHELHFNSLTIDSTEIVHEIKMNTSFKATFLWIFIIRWLHNALIEEAFDKVENYFFPNSKETSYSLWVNFLRSMYKRTSFKTKQA